MRQSLADLQVFFAEKQRQGESPFVALTSVTDAIERFALWAGNIGALRRPESKMSLDFRLSDAADVRHQIHRQLDEMIDAMTSRSCPSQHADGKLSNAKVTVRRIADGTIPNQNTALDLDELDPSTSSSITEGDTSKDPKTASDEASAMLEIILESIRSLFRIGIIVRKLSPPDRFRRALQAPDSAFLPSFDIEHVEHSHPKTKSAGLATRLGDAIAKRRQFIRYCQNNRLDLGADESLRNVERVSPDSLWVPDELEDGAVTLPSVPTISDPMSNLRLPLLADLCQNQEPFECPICSTLQSFQSESSWR